VKLLNLLTIAQDAPQYVELVFRAAKRANSQPGTEEYRTKQAFDFYMAMMNPPELSLLMKGSARYVFFGEVDPFIDAVEPLFEVCNDEPLTSVQEAFVSPTPSVGHSC